MILISVERNDVDHHTTTYRFDVGSNALNRLKKFRIGLISLSVNPPKAWITWGTTNCRFQRSILSVALLHSEGCLRSEKRFWGEGGVQTPESSLQERKIDYCLINISFPQGARKSFST